MSKRVLCKYFAHGACFKGEYCEFSHDWNAPANNICTFYQKGICMYGSRCRYEHVKPSKPESLSVSSSSNNGTSLVFDNVPQAPSPPFSSHASDTVSIHEAVTSSDNSFIDPTKLAWNLVDVQRPDYYEEEDNLESRSADPADRPLCSYAAVGECPRGSTCPHIHGDLCSTCGKRCLHPFRSQERDEHITDCQKRQRQLDALKLSQEIECSVCLESVLSKATAAERKFGILSECDHPFCISCIRNWRSSSPTPGMDVNGALRACPICRKLSYFIIPSVIWYATKEEKEEIIESYKAKLKSIDCKHFDFGSGSCPFGTSCFYKHAYRDGRLEEVVLRHLSAEDGQTVIAKNIRLSDFLSDLHLR